MMKTITSFILFHLCFQISGHASVLSCDTAVEGSRVRVNELLKQVCTTSGIYEDDFKRNIKEKILRILPQEKAILRSFTNDCYRQINSNLRSDNGDLNALELSSYLMNGVCKYPKRRGVVYRGVNYTPADLTNYEIGKVVEFKAFSSTSIDLYSAAHFAINALLVIDTHSGRKINFSSKVEEEKEVLLLPNTKYEVISNKEIFFQGRKMKEIKMRELNL